LQDLNDGPDIQRKDDQADDTVVIKKHRGHSPQQIAVTLSKGGRAS
jgi:hypothetical protein